MAETDSSEALTDDDIWRVSDAAVALAAPPLNAEQADLMDRLDQDAAGNPQWRYQRSDALMWAELGRGMSDRERVIALSQVFEGRHDTTTGRWLHEIYLDEQTVLARGSGWSLTRHAGRAMCEAVLMAPILAMGHEMNGSRLEPGFERRSLDSLSAQWPLIERMGFDREISEAASWWYLTRRTATPTSVDWFIHHPALLDQARRLNSSFREWWRVRTGPPQKPAATTERGGPVTVPRRVPSGGIARNYGWFGPVSVPSNQVDYVNFRRNW